MLEALGSIAGAIGSLFGQNQARQDQLDAAQNSVSWRVADANRAGVHPLAALGMSPISVSPIAVGDTGDSLARAGQSVDRAVQASSTGAQVTNRLATMLAKAQVEGAYLDNDIKRAELVSRVRRSNAPGTALVPTPGPNTARGGDIGGQTLPMPFGLPELKTGPSATAEEFERQYGDVAQEFYGGARLLEDGSNYIMKGIKDDSRIKAADDWIKRMAAELFGINPAY